MHDINNLRFILHVSDFHLSDNEEKLEHAKAALRVLTKRLKSEGCKIEYLIHTGDIIDSSDLFDSVAKKYGIPNSFWEEIEQKSSDGKPIKKFLYEDYSKTAIINSNLHQTSESPSIPADKLDWTTAAPTLDHLKVFDAEVQRLVKNRFIAAEKVMHSFITDLNVAFGNVIICSGNHDVLRPLSIDNSTITCTNISNDDWKYDCPTEANEIVQPFNEFLDKMKVANSKDRYEQNNENLFIDFGSVTHCILDDLNVLILNTNWINPKKQKSGYYCVRCQKVKEAINNCNSDDQDRNRLNIILAHKPIYEICEKARLSYKRYTKTSFLSKLQGFVGDHGIYLCGDKHTRSIVASYFHDIPHYIGGEPISVNSGHISEIEYNLLAISNGQISMERKLHLSNSGGIKWDCDIRPQDDTVKDLYKLSKKYVIQNSFEALGAATSYPTWESLCQDLYNWTDKKRNEWNANIDQLYYSICRYRINGRPENNDLPNTGIFQFIQQRIIDQMKTPSSKNILNIRGEHSSSKSMFLGLFYLHLMMEYSKGKVDFIPAYFNLESKDINKKIESGVSYFKAVTGVFEQFAAKVQDIAIKEHQPVCYIIDGLDELDCWSLYTEDSVGRGLLDILENYTNAWYIMAFSQHNLPRFKNTMPTRKYNDSSDIMYFNPIDVSENGSKDSRFTAFVEAFLRLRGFPSISPAKSSESTKKALAGTSSTTQSINECTPKNENLSKGVIQLKLTSELVEDVCGIIRNFRRLTITPGFLYQNYDYLTELNWEKNELQHKNVNVTSVYSYYIDRQNERCLDQLGYGYVNYAPAMAYLFSYKGYTYERFKHLNRDSVLSERHTLKPICENDDKIYPTFLFIKKNKDAREYLIAIHYNRELRYYAEHPNETIEEDSILNEFISRNIAVMIRKLWSDTNKFVIACEQLLQREELGNCTQSMLIYCLAHIQMYEPIRNELQNLMRKKAIETLEKQGLWSSEPSNNTTEIQGENKSSNLWDIQGKNHSERLMRFLQLSLKHSLVIYDLINGDYSDDLVKKYMDNNSFCAYNRQYQMLYYGDLSNKNDANIHPLKPGFDVVYGGFDFHDCFNYLYVKLTSGSSYPLRKYDLFTMLDLIDKRLTKSYLEEHSTSGKGHIEETFFYRPKDQDRAATVLLKTLPIVKEHCKGYSQDQHDYFLVWEKKIEAELDRVMSKQSESSKLGNNTPSE